MSESYCVLYRFSPSGRWCASDADGRKGAIQQARDLCARHDAEVRILTMKSVADLPYESVTVTTTIRPGANVTISDD